MPKGYALPHRTWSRSLTRRWVPTATYSDLGKLRQLAVVRLSRGPFNRQFLRTQQVCLERAAARPRGGKRRPRKQFTELVREGAGRRGVLGKRGPAVACSRRKQGRPRREGSCPALPVIRAPAAAAHRGIRTRRLHRAVYHLLHMSACHMYH